MRGKRYWLIHLYLLLAVVGFAAYAFLTRWLFPNGFFHCAMYDLLHLYCPFCGGTRAFVALLGLHWQEALRLNIAALIAGVAVLLLDLRAFVLLCMGKGERLFPKGLWRGFAVWFVLYGLARNVGLLLGLDASGDLIGYWQGTNSPWRALLFLALGAAFSVALLGVLHVWRESPLLAKRTVWAWLIGYTATGIAALLYSPWLLLLLLPLGVGHLIWYQRKKARE